MGHFDKNAKWHDKIYQIERTDPVVGGEGGISNQAPMELADRTEWLKQQIELQQCSSIAELRSIEPTQDKQMIYVKGYYANSTKGGGYFVADLADTATADNGGTVIVTANGNRWKRIYTEITPFDFGAVGDGQTDDTAAFDKLEVLFFKYQVNLCNATFVLNQQPNRNFYYNGRLRVDSRYRQVGLPKFGVKWSKNAGEGFVIDELQPKADSIATNSAGILQNIVYDYVNKHYYAQSVKSGTLTGGDELVVLTRYTRDGTTYLKSDVESALTDKLGHQGLGLEYVDGGLKLWASAGSYKYPNNGNYVVRFTPPANGTDIADLEEYKVWDTQIDHTRNYISNSVTISPQGDLMCVMGIWDGQKQARVRIFDMDVFSAGAGDYTSKWLYTWDLPDEYNGELNPYQSVVTDGQFVYVLMGKSEMQIFTLDGHRVFKTQHSIGKNKCAELVKKGYTNSYEPESLLWLPTAGGFNLCMSVVMGYNWREGAWSEGKARYKNLIFSHAPFEVMTQQTSVSDNGLQTTGRIAALHNEAADSGVFAYSTSGVGRRIGYLVSNSSGVNAGASITLYDLADNSNAKGSMHLGFSTATQEQKVILDAAYASIRPNKNNLLNLGLDWAKWSAIFVETPTADDDSHKVVNSAWVQKLFKQRDRSQNGWLKHGDLILQWGVATSQASSGKVALPIAYPTKLLYADFGEVKSNYDGHSYSFAWVREDSSTTEAAWLSTGTAGAFSYFTIGY